MVEADCPQGERSGQQADMREQDSDRIFEAGEFLKNWRRFNQLTVRLRLLHLVGETTGLEVRLRDDKPGWRSRICTTFIKCKPFSILLLLKISRKTKWIHLNAPDYRFQFLFWCHGFLIKEKRGVLYLQGLRSKVINQKEVGDQEDFKSLSWSEVKRTSQSRTCGRTIHVTGVQKGSGDTEVTGFYFGPVKS